MNLVSGSRIGPYEIVSLLDAGGMGEVYRARDTLLKRDVALKILPESFSEDPDRLARFQREAEVLASLNHPNIAHLYGLEKADGRQALVMELVEGPTLADRIEEGPIPLTEALLIARQIAEALEAAHERAIVHRDLKPANVKVKEDGTVKVLDFGLAKTFAAAAMSGDIANSPTLTSPAMTGQGIILGTAAYMAPEQARGKPVDKRADIWAFGVVLFEMLTGRRLFAGADVTETIALVVTGQPDLSQVPPAVKRLVGRCLEKEPSRRLRDIGDVWELLEHPAPDGVPTSAIWSRLLWNGGLVLTGAALGVIAWLVGVQRDAEPPLPIRFVDSMPDGAAIPFGVGLGTPVAVSPDGRTIVYNVQKDGQFWLYRRFIDQTQAEPIGDRGATEPFFSPDGRWVGFRSEGKTLKRVPVRGGPAHVIAELPGSNFYGASWNADGSIILGGLAGGLWRVSQDGGQVSQLTKPAEGRIVSYPQLLPGGHAVLYTERESSRSSGIPGNPNSALLILDLQSGTSKRLFPGLVGRYVPTGHLVFVSGATLWAVAFDLDRLDVRGTPVPVVEDIRAELNEMMANAVVAETGTLVYVSGASQQRSLVWVNRQRLEQAVGVEPRAYANPRVSPDGSRIAVTTQDEGRDVWVWDVARRRLRQLTFDATANWLAAWFPDSKRLAFSMASKGTQQVFWQAADGSGVPEALTHGSISTLPYAISRDEHLLLQEYPDAVNSDIAVISLQNPQARRPVRRTAAIERNAAFSPDGRWLAYESNQDVSGRFEIYLRPFPNVEASEQKVTTDGGTAPVWSRDGSELFYWKETGETVSIMSVPVTRGPTLVFGPADTVIQGRYAHPSWATQYDVAPDGRFVLLKPVESSSRDEVRIVLNWHEELKRLVPTK